MFYFERSYRVLNQINRLSLKVVYDTIRPFTETPPEERDLKEGEPSDNKAADLFSLFTADIIKSNMVFTR